MLDETENAQGKLKLLEAQPLHGEGYPTLRNDWPARRVRFPPHFHSRPPGLHQARATGAGTACPRHCVLRIAVTASPRSVHKSLRLGA